MEAADAFQGLADQAAVEDRRRRCPAAHFQVDAADETVVDIRNVRLDAACDAAGRETAEQRKEDADEERHGRRRDHQAERGQTQSAVAAVREPVRELEQRQQQVHGDDQGGGAEEKSSGEG